MNYQPPKIPTKIIRWWCSSPFRDEIEGDLYEDYQNMLAEHGKTGANLRYWWTVLRSLRWYLRAGSSNELRYNFNQIDMLHNYFKIALRNLLKKKGHSIINIGGLAVGLAGCLLISIFIRDELSYDRFHTNVEEIHRVESEILWGGEEVKTFMTPTALLPNVQRNFPSVKTGTRTFRVGIFSPPVVSNGEDSYSEERFYYVDSTFFDVFSFRLLQGSTKNALSKPNSLVLTESTAVRYFGTKEAMGKMLKVGEKEFTVTGIVEDVPGNSHFHFDLLASFSSLRVSRQEIWDSANYSTYFRVDPSQAPELETGISGMVYERLKDYLSENDKITYKLKPITDIHLYSDMTGEHEAQGDIKYVIALAFIGGLILLIACINYINLATAKATERAQEVGMRKTLGAQKYQLIYQFIGESLVIATLAMILAVILSGAALPVFNHITGKLLTLEILTTGWFVFSICGGVLLVTLLAGIYPAFILSRLKPINIVKGGIPFRNKGRTRKSLVVVQFVISIFLIISTLVVHKQLQFIQNKKLGYDKENVVVLPINSEIRKDHKRIKEQLAVLPEVKSVSYGSDSPAEIQGGYSIEIEGLEEGFGLTAITVEREFNQTMQISVIHGSDFTATDETLSTLEGEDRSYAFIVNESLTKFTGISGKDIIGRKANVNGRTGTIKGVVNDFHFASLHQKISPLAMFIEPAQYNQMLVRLNEGNISDGLSALKAKFSEIVPARPFTYGFLDQEYAALYDAEQRLGNVFIIFSSVAIIIACMGLFGLVSYTTIQRAKELSIRKVLGASVGGLIFYTIKDYATLIVISIILAIPMGYYGMTNWLESFEYRISIGVLPFLLSITITGVIAFLTVANHAIGSALSNPVKALKSNE